MADHVLVDHAVAAEPAPWSRDCKVRVWRTGRFWRPWECDVHHGPTIFGEPGCDWWSAWTRKGAIRKGLRVISGHADFELTYGRPTTVKIEERTGL